MIFRFSLYGFLKNLRLFEAFLVLALLDRGLDFFAIGGLIAVREIAVNCFEIPSGAVADGFGRKRCMVASMGAYIISYLILGMALEWWVLAIGMVCYGMGDAFRSGTHKALIYAWLRQQGRTEERTRIYGYTRSWSKFGSAASALIASILIVAGADYAIVFIASAVPAALNLINLASYPSSLDQPSGEIGGVWRAAWGHLGRSLRTSTARGPIRSLIMGSLAVEGSYKVAKDYLQPVLQSVAIGLPLALGFDDQQRTGLVVGMVAALLYLLASVASRQAHRLESRWGSADRATGALARSQLVIYAGLAICLLASWAWLAVLGFALLGIAQNLWRPIHVGRFDQHGDAANAASILSVEEQAKSLAAAAWAPLIGAAVDASTTSTGGAIDLPALWPVTLLGIPLLLVGRGSRKGAVAAATGQIEESVA